MKFPSPAPFRQRLALSAAAALLAVVAAQPALAANVSLSGNLASDDGVQILTLNLSGAGAITVTSIGYAGGTTFGGGSVAAGGFDTVMYLFSSTGALLYQSDDGVSVPTDPSTGEALDAAFTTASLAAGVYTLALAQADNYLLGFNLSAGFAQAGTGNFSAAFGCSNAAFCDYAGNNRNSSWTLNFSGNTLTSVVPEPGSLALVLAAGGALVGLGRPRRKPAQADARLAPLGA
jgi:hypothetical protein